MIKRTLLALSATVALAFSGTAQAQESTSVQTMQISRLRGVRAHSGFNVTLTQGPTSKAVITVDGRLKPYLRATVDDGVLSLGFSNLPRDLQRMKLRKAEITVGSLEKLEAHSGAQINGSGSFTARECEIDVHSGALVENIDVTAKEIEVEVHSGARAVVSGSADQLEASAASGASCDLYGLKAVNATVSASSGASLGCWATGSLNAKASSGASVRYDGTPADRNVSNSSGGSVRQRK